MRENGWGERRIKMENDNGNDNDHDDDHGENFHFVKFQRKDLTRAIGKMKYNSIVIAIVIVIL